MAAQFGTLVADTSGGIQAVTDIPFTPKLLLVWTNGISLTDPEAVTGGDYRMSFGASDGSRSRTVSFAQNDASPVTRSNKRNDRILHVIQPGGTIDGSASLVSLNSNGFTITWDTTPTSAFTVQYLAVGGGDITDVRVDDFDANTNSAGNHSLTGVGFQADSIMMMAGSQNAFNTDRTTEALLVIGATDGVREANLHFKKVDEILDTEAADLENATVVAVGDRWLQGYSGDVTGGPDWDIGLVTLDADGFTYNVGGTSTGTWPVIYIAVKGATIELSTMLSSPAATGTVAYSGASKTPEACIFFSVGKTSGDPVNDNPPTIAAASALTKRGYSAWYSENDVGENAGRAQGSDRMVTILDRTDTAQTATEEEADIDSFDANGVTLDWTKVNAARAVEFFLLYISAGAVGGTFGSGIIYADGILP